jgi:hypothetical protein
MRGEIKICGTRWTPESMIMATAQVCGGGQFGRTKQNGSAIFGFDALRIGIGRAGDGAAGADFAGAGTTVADGGFAERVADDGEVLRSLSRWSDSIGQATAKSAGGISGWSSGIWRICDCAVDESRLRGTVCRRVWAGANHHIGERRTVAPH